MRPPPPRPGPAPACHALFLQWTATSRGSWNRTRLEVFCGSALWPPCSGRLRLRMEGGHLLSPSWGGGGRQREAGRSKPPGGWGQGAPARIPAALASTIGWPCSWPHRPEAPAQAVPPPTLMASVIIMTMVVMVAVFLSEPSAQNLTESWNTGPPDLLCAWEPGRRPGPESGLSEVRAWLVSHSGSLSLTRGHGEGSGEGQSLGTGARPVLPFRPHRV